MKRIIDGKRYDTDTATEIGSASGPNGCGCTDFRWYEESLYQTPRGAYFLAGRGGPMSQYSQPYGQNGSSGGSEIIPMADDEARAWAERHLTADEVEIAFSNEIEDA